MIARERRHPLPDELELVRLNRVRRLVRDQIVSWRADTTDIAA